MHLSSTIAVVILVMVGRTIVTSRAMAMVMQGDAHRLSWSHRAGQSDSISRDDLGAFVGQTFPGLIND